MDREAKRQVDNFQPETATTNPSSSPLQNNPQVEVEYPDIDRSHPA
jgi:hypothetical protein